MSWRSLRVRLFLAGLVSVAVALVAATAGLSLLFERHAERQLARELGAVLDGLSAQAEQAADGTWQVSAPPGEPRYERPLSGFYWQVMPAGGGAPLLQSRSLWDASLPLPASEGDLHRLPGPAGESLLALRRDVAMPARLGGQTLSFLAARDAAEVAAAAAAFRGDLLPFLAMVGGLLLAASALQLAIGLRPLSAIQARLAAIRSGRQARLDASFPTEILPLARELDHLLAERERDVSAARARAADLAHGLKTPIQVLLAEADRLAQREDTEGAEAVGEAAEAMRRHVERELGRVRRAGRGRAESADPAVIAERLMRVLSRTEAGGRLAWELPGKGKPVAVHEDDLAEALGALLENAARHALARVRLKVEPAGELIAVAVTDDGPGLPAAFHAEALRRGGRLDVRGPGTGLGLAIAGDIAEAAGGRLVLGPTGAGEMTVALLLPAAPAKHEAGG